MKTRNGVYYDLEKSSYKVKVKDTGMVFVFSSDLHLVKFEEQLEENRNEHNVKMKARYKLNFHMKVLPDILLYKKIETRGFLVMNEGGHKLCLENVQCGGEKMMLKNSST